MERPAISYETGLDEAFLIGTKDQLVKLANLIIDMANSDSEHVDYLGINTKQPHASNSLTQTMSDIVLDGMVIVDSEQDKRDLINKIRLNNNDDPIDWIAHDAKH